MIVELTLKKIVNSKEFWEDEEPTFDQFETFLIDQFYDNPEEYFPTIKEVKE